MWDLILVAIIVAAAAAWVGWRLIKTARAKQPSCGCGCGSSSCCQESCPQEEIHLLCQEETDDLKKT